jgi:predicted MFS family arabinose efflux permease
MGSTWGWKTLSVILLFITFAVCAVSLIVWGTSSRWVKTGQVPFIQFGMFANPRVCLGIATTVITSMAVFSTQLVMPVYLRTVLHVQPAVVGLILLAYPVTLIFIAPCSGKLSDRLGSLPIIYIGLTTMVAALIALSFLTTTTSIFYIIAFTLILGCSMGMINSPNNNLTLSSVPNYFLGLIGSIIALSRNMGMILGTVAGGALMTVSKDEFPFSQIFQNDQVVVGFRAIFYLTATLVASIFAVLLVTARRSKRKTLPG